MPLAFLEPVLVRPFEFFCVPHNGGVLGRVLKKETVRIGLQHDVSVNVPDFKFVNRTFAHAWNENLPNARRAERTHHVPATVPVIEAADHADALGIWGPNGEARAGHAIDDTELRTQFFVNAAFVTFAKEVEVRFAKSWQKRIRI